MSIGGCYCVRDLRAGVDGLAGTEYGLLLSNFVSLDTTHQMNRLTNSDGRLLDHSDTEAGGSDSYDRIAL